MTTSTILFCDDQATQLCYRASADFLTFLDKVASIQYFVLALFLFFFVFLLTYLIVKN